MRLPLLIFFCPLIAVDRLLSTELTHCPSGCGICGPSWVSCPRTRLCSRVLSVQTWILSPSIKMQTCGMLCPRCESHEFAHLREQILCMAVGLLP